MDSPSERRGLAKPISKPAQAPWDSSITHQDLQKLIKGFLPQDMDDKWLCETTGPDKQGEYLVQLARSWTQATIAALRVRCEVDEKGALLPDRPARIHELIWEKDTLDYYGEIATKESMKEMVRNLCKGLVGVQLPSDS